MRSGGKGAGVHPVLRRVASAVAIAVVAAALARDAAAQALSIYEIQYTEDPNGVSPYDGSIVDCSGGICVAKCPGYRLRLILQDPNCPDGWGGIQVNDWMYPYDLFYEVQIGDWIEFTNLRVEEFRGTTVLQRESDNDPEYTIVSHDNPLPPVAMVSVSDIPAPLYDPGDDAWYVENHDAERYESMRLLVRDITVTEMDLGKAVDNYNLEDADGADCWASDYLNEEVEPSDYHRFVSVGQHFCGISGIFEQYTNYSTGWDYYQLLTLTSADLAICGDVDHDGEVDLADLAQLLGGYGTTSGACFEDGDQNYDGDVDLADLAELLGSYGFTLP
jgi:hypothetical protein